MENLRPIQSIVNAVCDIFFLYLLYLCRKFKRNTLQKVRIRGQDKLPHHNGDCKKKVIDKNNEKCYFVEVVIQFVHLRVTTEEIENHICDLNNVGC